MVIVLNCPNTYANDLQGLKDFCILRPKILKNILIMSLLKRSVLFLGVLFISVSLMGQSVADAGGLYNDGNTYYKEKDYSSAVTAYEEALEMARLVGSEADDLKGKIETQLVKAYYADATGLYKKKKFDEAIAAYEKTAVFAKEVGDTDRAKKSTTNIAKVRTTKGTSLLKQNKVDDAIVEFDKSLEIYPKYYKTFYGMMLAYKSKDDMTKMMENADKVIEYGGANSKAAKTVKKTKSTVSKALINAGAKEIQRERPAGAIQYINDSFKYADGGANAYYYLALAYSKEGKFDDAISAAQKAISIEPEKDKSDVYFALGLAYEGKGDNTNACDAYKKVTSGPNVEAAKYQMTQVIKCG